MFTRDSILVRLAGVAVLLVVGYVVWADSAPEYELYQGDFRALVRAQLGAQRAAAVPSGIQQIYLPELRRADRCTTCHLGVTWKGLEGAPLPHTAHAPEPLEQHPLPRFGCVVCHGGQPLATRLPDAHGWVAHWEDPLLDTTLAEEYGMKDRHAFLEIRCNMCHRFERATRGAPNINLAKKLVEAKGCRACHVINGRGGTVGPDLTRVGEKPPEQYDYGRLTTLASVYSWQVGHLQNPRSFSPGTVMPEFGFTTEEAQALGLLLLSWRDVDMPPELLPGLVRRDVPTKEEAERERVMREGDGKFFVEKTCFICHDVSVFGIESATKIGPDLALAVEDAPRRFGVPVDEFLRKPSGTMSVVLSRQIILTPEELEEAIRLLHVAHEAYKRAHPEGATGSEAP